MGFARPVGWSFSPLDEELGLLSQRMTPRLVEQVARLGVSCVSFREARDILADLLGVELSINTVRRITEGAGAQADEEEREQAAALRKSMARPAGMLVDRLQQVSVDGAMAPLVTGTWGEVKCVAIGRIEQTSAGPKAKDITYFARLADADGFINQARAEMHRRGTENAREVVAVSDGAPWIQSYIDEHCPQALRIIDWGHAAGYVRTAGQLLFGAESADGIAWTKTQLDLLWAGKPEDVVSELARLQDDSERLKAVRDARHYLEKRLDMLRYSAFRGGGYPIGSGIVESANKLLVEARLKGAGKHWAPANVNSVLALRCSIANKRWPSQWPAVHARLRPTHRRRPSLAPLPPPQVPGPELAVPGRTYVRTFEGGKPTRNHPWNASLTPHAKM